VKILVVDDDEGVCAVVSSLLERAGFEALAAYSGRAGLDCFEEHRAAIGLVISDLTMPGMGGLEMVELITQREPQIRVVFMSGFAEEGQELEARGKFPFLRKPFSAEELLAAVEAALSGRVATPAAAANAADAGASGQLG
jgi:two-component system cell cycle sensor histidine kinase/response regulator CckA